jgi:hypothetical protein
MPPPPEATKHPPSSFRPPPLIHPRKGNPREQNNPHFHQPILFPFNKLDGFPSLHQTTSVHVLILMMFNKATILATLALAARSGTWRASSFLFLDDLVDSHA